jgi:sugar lactone lactonase YvrE
MLSVDKGEQRQWRFPEQVSAAGWVSRDVLLIAGERDLFLFDVETEEVESVVDLESDNRQTRSNDGRADPQGGFWIGTMGKRAEPGVGAIYRFYRGELKRLFGGITIPNAICFSPDGRSAHFTDTVTKKVMRVGLDSLGWPNTAPQVYLDLTADASGPDGAVIDTEGAMWLAQWGAGRVSVFAPDGQLLRQVAFAAPHTSCPAFGGPGLKTLFCTSALQGMDAAARAKYSNAGKTFTAREVGRGQAENRVLL